MVVWLIGLSGSGKTTIGRRLQALLDSSAAKWVLLDGDAFREVMGPDAGHTLEERRKNAYRISRMCRLLDLQGVNVIACVLSLFQDNRDFNRTAFADYREVYIKVGIGKLELRDNKGLYAAARSGAIKDVAGVDLPFAEPERPDLVLDNEADAGDFDGLAAKVAERLGLRTGKSYAYPRSGHSPEKYQYTPFEGRDFLDAYAASRDAAAAALGSRVERLERAFPDLRGAHFLADRYSLAGPAGFFLARELPQPSATPEDGVVRTRSLLLRALSSATPEFPASLARLLQRFEVTKKVHAAYRVPEWRKSPDAGTEPMDRILLSLALLDALGREGDPGRTAVAFNAVLKLNDLIASESGALATPGELYLARAALKEEATAFRRLREAWNA